MRQISFPAFFSIERHGGRSHHIGHALFQPELSGVARTLSEATVKLLEAVRAWERDGGGEGGGVLGLCAGTEQIMEDVVQLDLRGRIGLNVMLIRFRVGAYEYVAVPRLGEGVMIFEADLPRGEFLDQIQQQINRQLRAQQKQGEELDALKVQGGDRVVMVDFWARFAQEKMSLGGLGGLTDLRALMGDDPEFKGEHEIRKVAYDLNQLHPDRLRLALVPDERVALLHRALYEPPPIPTALIGPPGSGKTTLVHSAISQYLHHVRQDFGTDPEPGIKVWHLDPTRIVSGMSIIGHWQRRMEAILGYLVTRRKELNRKRPDALFLDNPVALTQVGRYSGGNLSASDLMRPWLERRAFPVVVEATPEEWKKLEERDRPFADLFQIIRVDAPERRRALRMVLSQLDGIESQHEVKVQPDGLERLLELERRHPESRVLPGSALGWLERTAARNRSSVIDRPMIDRAFQERSGLRRKMFDPGERVEERAVRDALSQQLIGQPAAVDALIDVVLSMKAGLLRPDKPIATFLLVGPTGVGKTEAAKVLSGWLFDRADALVRFDMNEFIDGGAVERLVGDGSREGLLTGRLHNRPFAVLLFDEIEKAHPSVHDLLLQVLDEGRLTDGRGRRADMRGCVILLTSNVGSQDAGRSTGFDRSSSSLGAIYRRAVENAFRPEFVNRLDRVISFAPLEPAQIRRIADLQIRRLLSREGFARRTVLLDVPPAVLDRLVAEGYDVTLGARALKRVLEARLVGPVAETISDRPPDVPLWLQGDYPDAATASGKEKGKSDIHVSVAAFCWPAHRALPAPDPGARPAEGWAELERIEQEVSARVGGEIPVAISGPRGTESPASLEVSLVEWLRGLYASARADSEEEWDREEERELSPESVPARARQRKVVTRDSVTPRNHRCGVARRWRQEASAFLNMREALLDLAMTAELVQVDSLALAHRDLLLARCYRKELNRPRSFRIVATPLVRSQKWAFDFWEKACQLAVEKMLGQWERVEAGSARRIYQISGLCPLHLWKKEAGIHLFLPDGHPPRGLWVQILAEGEPALEVSAENLDGLPAVRLYCEGTPDRQHGLVQDLATDMSVAMDETDMVEEWPHWLLAGEGG